MSFALSAYRYAGRHRAPETHRARNSAIVAGTVGAAALAPLAASGTASAASSADWNKVAACESGNNWHINTGNGYYGGLQFSASTWTGFGGGAYASRADLATPAQQMAIANRVLAKQGWGAWPVCSRKAGVTGHSTGGGATSAAPSHHTTTTHKTTTKHRATHSAPAAKAPTHAAPRHAAPERGNPAGTYVVHSGDTLSKIAAQHRVAGGWHQVYRLNANVVSNPNLIYPGEKLRLA